MYCSCLDIKTSSNNGKLLLVISFAVDFIRIVFSIFRPSKQDNANIINAKLGNPFQSTKMYTSVN